LLALAGLVALVRARRLGLALALAVGAVVPILLALGTHFPLYAWLWHHFPPLRYPRVPERFMPVACLALAGLVAFAVARLSRAAPALVTLCYLVVGVAVFADLRLWVSSYRSVAADPANAAYAALRSQPPGRLLELPVLHPSVAHGSLYLYYDMQAQRQRPGGYSTVAPKAAATLALKLEPLSCGEWRAGFERLLSRLGVRYVAVHGGLDPDQGWFAWRELNTHGWGVLARGGTIATFARGRPATPPALPEPGARIVFCAQWNGRSPLYRHGAFWIRGGGDLVVRLESNGPDRTWVSADGTTRSVRVVGPKTLRVPLASRRWHLVGVTVRRADRHVRLVQIATTR
jgi:hypothetical protein